MLAHERQAQLQSLLEQEGRVVVSELAKRWDVSEMTVRRDLKTLEEKGVVARVHGGAVAGGALRWRSRLDKHRSDKKAAASKLATLLPDVGCIYLDGSTTIYHLAEHLAHMSGIMVVTNNVDTLQLVQQFGGIEAVLLGGRLDTATDNLVGPMTRRCLESLAFDVAFFSAFALDADAGLCEPQLEDAEVKQWVQQRSRTSCVAMNHQKFHGRAAATWQVDPATATLATDLISDDPRIASFTKYFHRIL